MLTDYAKGQSKVIHWMSTDISWEAFKKKITSTRHSVILIELYISYDLRKQEHLEDESVNGMLSPSHQATYQWLSYSLVQFRLQYINVILFCLYLESWWNIALPPVCLSWYILCSTGSQTFHMACWSNDTQKLILISFICCLVLPSCHTVEW